MKVKRERLHKQISLLRKCQSEMICTELQNIEELKAEKQMFDFLSDSILKDFNFTFFTNEFFAVNSSVETVVASPHNG